MKLIIDIPKDAYEKAKTMGEAFGFPSPIVKAVAHGTPIIEARQETLEQEPCEDAVSREAILLEIDKIKDNYGGLLDVAMFIRGLPSVSPQPKTGHWIEDEDEMKVWCSECGEENDRCSKCCPNCGIKMVKPQEGEG